MTIRKSKCLCQERANRVVDLTPWFYPMVHLCESDCNPSNDIEKAMSLELCLDLVQNLSQIGWSLVCLDAKAICKNNNEELIDDDLEDIVSFLTNHNDWGAMIQEIFEAQYTEDAGKCDIMNFRASESGAPGSSDVEPKWSWEISTDNAIMLHEKKDSSLRSNASLPLDSAVAKRLSTWARLLHVVEVAISRALQLPIGILVDEDHLSNPIMQTTECGMRANDCIDLLRAFYYHPVPSIGEKSFRKTLGSSPHTDWGSFTIVYQDSVGGLQTFCEFCQSWTDVLPQKDTTAQSRFVHFVVHVSDMASLAINRALNLRMDKGSNLSAQNSESSGAPYFPSPLHRVVSPTEQPRVSLVYFGYPPGFLSISEIAEQLQDWIGMISDQARYQLNTPKPCSLYDKYYLLKNQSAQMTDGGELGNLAARDCFESIMNQTARSILKKKWKQVERKV